MDLMEQYIIVLQIYVQVPAEVVVKTFIIARMGGFG